MHTGYCLSPIALLRGICYYYLYVSMWKHNVIMSSFGGNQDLKKLSNFPGQTKTNTV